MRFNIFLALLLSNGFAACSQDINAKRVPTLVKNALLTKFPDATDIEWEKNNNRYEADYDVDNTECAASIDASGKIIMYKQEIQVTELPAILSGTLQQNFAGYTIEDSERIQKGDQVFYQVKLEKNNQELKRVFSENGQVANAFIYWD